MSAHRLNARRVSPVLSILLATTAMSLATALVVGSNDASASAFQLKENSAKALGRAFAGASAAPDDYAVVVNNPAAMIRRASYLSARTET